VSKPVCPGELEDQAVIARRGDLDREQRRSLGEHLDECGLCRASRDAALAFDDSGDVQVGDEEIVRRTVDAAMTASRAPGRSHRGRVLRPAVTALVLFATAAAAAAAGGRVAAYLGMGPFFSSAQQEGSTMTKVVPARRGFSAMADVERVDRDPTSSVRGAAGAGPSEPEGARATAARPPASGVTSTVPALVPSAAVRPAAALFARAKEARREGRTGEAIAAFRRLQRDYPDSPEAVVSLVSVGELLAAASAWVDALECFDAYLRRAPAGPLAPEALAGKEHVLMHAGLGEAAAVGGEVHRP
jgi:tetratricopeptide (TPR) repeat protein